MTELMTENLATLETQALESTTLGKANEKSGSSRVLKTTVSDILSNKLNKLAEQKGISTSKLIANLLSSATEEKPGASARSIASEPLVIEDTVTAYISSVNRSSKAFSSTLSEANDSIKKTSVNFTNTVRLSLVGLQNAVEETETIVNTSNTMWSNLLREVTSVRVALDDNRDILREYNDQRQTFQNEIKWFKKALTTETHDYRKKLDRFAVKHYTFGLCFITIATTGLFFTLKYMP